MASELLDRQTKMLIAQTIVDFAVENKIENIKVSEVCKKIGISRQTFYYHFKDIYEGVAWYLMQKKEEEGYNSCQDWDTLVEKEIRHAFRYRDLARAVQSSSYLHLMNESYIEKGLSITGNHMREALDGEEMDQRDFDFMLESWYGMLFAVIIKWEMGKNLDRTEDELIEFLQKAIGPAIITSVKEYAKSRKKAAGK